MTNHDFIVLNIHEKRQGHINLQSLASWLHPLTVESLRGCRVGTPRSFLVFLQLPKIRAIFTENYETKTIQSRTAGELLGIRQSEIRWIFLKNLSDWRQWPCQVVSNNILGTQIGNAMSQNVVERILCLGRQTGMTGLGGLWGWKWFRSYDSKSTHKPCFLIIQHDSFWEWTKSTHCETSKDAEINQLSKNEIQNINQKTHISWLNSP